MKSKFIYEGVEMPSKKSLKLIPRATKRGTRIRIREHRSGWGVISILDPLTPVREYYSCRTQKQGEQVTEKQQHTS